MSYAVMPLSDWQNILASVKNKTGKSDALVSGNVAREINSIDNNGYIIPTYVIEEAEATIAKAYSHGNLGRTIRFIAISDTHEDSANSHPTAGMSLQIETSNRHAGQAIRYIADKMSLDFIAHLGDASGCASWSTTYPFDALCEDVKRIDKYIFSNIRSVNSIFLVGNHDQTSANGRSLLNSGAYPLFGSLSYGNKDIPGGYGYFDLDTAKVRVIYLNTSDSPSSSAYLAVTSAQKNWLCETLINVNTKSNASQWSVLLLSHAPLDISGVVDVTTDILLPYVNGGSYSSYSFNGKNSAKIIGNVHGHVHCYSYGYLKDRIRRFTIPNACYLGNNHYLNHSTNGAWADPTTYNKTANSGKDTAFSLVTIDLDSGQCYVDNYGAGIDRAFSTDYKPVEIVVPKSLSNISYNGVTTVGKTIDKSKFTFKVTYSDGTTATKTGAASVTPTTIASVGNNTVTITYTENGTTVTATATIVGTAIPSYSITNHLTNCVNSNSATTVNEGSAYSATITAKSGYKLESVTVTMGGSNVSVTNGVISINNVTGAIEITATAVMELVNEIRTSVDTDETTKYNGTGYALTQRLGSDGTIRTGASGCVASGLIPYNGQDVELVIPTTAINNSNTYLHTYIRYSGAIKAIVPFKLSSGTQVDGSHRQINYWVNEWGVTYKTVGSTTVLTIPASTIAASANGNALSSILYLRVSSVIASGVTVNDSTLDSTFRVSYLPDW